MDELRQAIQELLIGVSGKLYGDTIIGYRIQGTDGKYYDGELKEIYDLYHCTDDCTDFNDVCFSLRSGCHNW